MFILVNPRKHGGRCPPKSHGHGASGTQPFSCLFFLSQPCAFQKFGFSIFIGLSVNSDLFGIQVSNQYLRNFLSVESRKPPHRPTVAQTAFRWDWASRRNLKIGHRGNRGFTQGSWVLSASPFAPDSGAGSQGTQGTQKLRAQFLRHLRHLRHWLVVQHLHQSLSVTAVAAEGHSQLPKLLPPTVHQLF